MSKSKGVWRHVILSVNDTNATIECRACGPDTEYWIQITKKGPRLRCANGKREQRRKRTLGNGIIFTEAEKFEYLKRQGGKCAICLKEIDMKAYVDHDHATGRVRGLLCGLCNSAIGMLKDDPARIRRAADYVEKGGI